MVLALLENLCEKPQAVSSSQKVVASDFVGRETEGK
jgi:hypothetical protein